MSEPLWWLTKDGDRSCLALYERHYSAYRYADGRERVLFIGPGEKVVLRTIARRWRTMSETLVNAGILVMLVAIFEAIHIKSVANAVAFFVGGAMFIIGNWARRHSRQDGD